MTIEAMDLAALRRSRGITQVELAERLGWTQASISRFERQSDRRVSTLATYIEGLGGVLSIGAIFADTNDYQRLVVTR